MPAEFVAAVTGHVLNNRSALYEYIDVTRALLMPGAVVLAGWQPFPWGRLGRGSVPASLRVLLTVGVTEEQLELFVDTLFTLDSASPPQLRRDGALRPVAHAAAASLVMYYEKRKEQGLMAKVQDRLLVSWTAGPGSRAAAAFASRISSSSGGYSSAFASRSSSSSSSSDGGGGVGAYFFGVSKQVPRRQPAPHCL
jgi:uncharacterized membrane protein YgcG